MYIILLWNCSDYSDLKIVSNEKGVPLVFGFELDAVACVEKYGEYRNRKLVKIDGRDL
jgi:hypothetical protein